MNEAARIPFADAKPGPAGSSLMPLLPLILSYGDRQKEAVGLLDTGAAVNVLPYSLGEQSGTSAGARYCGYCIGSDICSSSFGIRLDTGRRCATPFGASELLLGV